MRPLIELIRSIPEAVTLPDEATKGQVLGVAVDSANVQPGSVFFALKGEKRDGADFIPQAAERGAIVAFCSHDSVVPEGKIPVVRLHNPRLALARVAAAFYGAQPQHVVAITGTDGKTSTADFFRQLTCLMGNPSASMGTLGVLSGEGRNLYPGTLTTPDAVVLHRVLAELAGNGVQHVALEASSHGLHQYRLDGVALQAAAFTNIARDHLDYHQTEAAYFSAKARLFSEVLPEGKTAVLNQDDARFAELAALCAARGQRVIGFGKHGAELTLRGIVPHPHGQTVSLSLFGKEYTLEVPLVGGFQVMNILAAVGLVVGCGGELSQALSCVPQLKGVPGRLEQVVATKNGAAVFIDYAHTPMALANILHTLRPHTQGKLHVVFGCGGDRDAGKRPQMGKIAAELADRAIVTDDNPRSEDPALIRAAVMGGIENTTHCKEVADRAQAIYRATEALQAGDILVIAGKGHEKTQIIGGHTVPFDDAEVAREAAKTLGVAV